MSIIPAHNHFSDAAIAIPVMPKSVIVIPCYNEAKRLDAAAFVRFAANAPDVSFLFVNDGSTDNTQEVLDMICKTSPGRMWVLEMHQNSGKAEAVRQGMLMASKTGADFIGYWDADLATPLESISEFTKVACKYDETQVVYGARRRLLGHRIERTLGRRIVSSVCVFLARRAVGMPIGDTQCGAKLFRNSEAFRKSISREFHTGWLFDVELFARLAANVEERQFAFYEQPLSEWEEVGGSKVTTKAIVASGFKMLGLIANCWFRPQHV